MQLVSASPAQPAGSPGEPLGKRWASWLSSAGKPQKVSSGAGQRGQLGDVVNGEAKPVVGGGSDRDRDLDRDIEGRHDEGEERRLFGPGSRS